MELSIKGVSLSLGIVWGLSMLLMGWLAMAGWSTEIVSLMSSMYIGYDSTFLGGIIGGLWGFADGVIGGALFAVFYNSTK